ncbi:response regulator receiver and ANTAR domain protein [Chthonomonas calidirosea]|uniref:Response regulator receiver and ANTAR domain protein n=1 Tax=Chthonomonas calidirosea (strain DSM 23976 / ICMP 18418 / T49) TaxID=1303518 RepID=S0EU93_CHTCT|nr:response regulator [Chthonomonas calidirosea]CCW35253.1 response regulator receiver and ANTAR domain protein [Chthonomonas calidirosea T49]CEK20731.1 response regulator receiver and ANTAR domain protein [Chthonomonas calidirosea]
MQDVKILIAEDDALQRLDLKRMLQQLGHSVVGEAEDGEEACRLARNLRPDLTILDIMMPKIGGLEVAETLSKERICPVLMLTAYSDAPMIERACKAGVLAYLVKPYRQQELQPAITIAIARYRELLALEGALESTREERELVELMAKAQRALMYLHELTEREAERRLQALALSSGRSLREVAEAVLLAYETTSESPKRGRRR